MPGKEGEPRSPEQEPVPYCQAARFPDEQQAGQAYFQAQQAIFDHPDNALSTYRLQLNKVWHVAVLGEPPPAELDQKLHDILASGEATTLPQEVLKILAERRAKATKIGPWVEGHYRPGKRIR